MKIQKTKKGLREKENTQIGKLIGIFLLLSIFLIQIVLAQQADEYKPYLHNPSVGDVPKLETFGEFETELFPGAGTFRYNVNVPAGTNGLQPQISLFYNSQSATQRPGILGSGWSMTENNFMRDVSYCNEKETHYANSCSEIVKEWMELGWY